MSFNLFLGILCFISIVNLSSQIQIVDEAQNAGRPFKFTCGENPQMEAIVSASLSINCNYAGTAGSYCPTFDCVPPPSIQKLSTTSGNPLMTARIGVGLDISTGNLLLPVIDMSTAGPQTWVNSQGTVFSVPSQATVDTTPSNTSNTVFFETEVQYAAQFSFDPSGQSSGTKICGLLSQSSNAMQLYQQFFTNNMQSIGITQNLQSVFSVNLVSSTPSLDSYFGQALASLPTTYDYSIYQYIPMYWGTHVVTSGQFGGVIQQQVMVEECLWSSALMTDAEILAQVEIDLNKALNPTHKPPVGRNALFARGSTAQTLDITGGDPTLAPNDVAGRSASFSEDPVFTQYNYEPITNFISDPTMKANVQSAVQQYLAAQQDANEQATKQAAAARQAAFMSSRQVYAAMTFGIYNNLGVCFCSSAIHEFSLAPGDSNSFLCEDAETTVKCVRGDDGSLQVIASGSLSSVHGSVVTTGCSTHGNFGQFGYFCCFDHPPAQVYKAPTGKMQCSGPGASTTLLWEC